MVDAPPVSSSASIDRSGCRQPARSPRRRAPSACSRAQPPGHPTRQRGRHAALPVCCCWMPSECGSSLTQSDEISAHSRRVLMKARRNQQPVWQLALVREQRSLTRRGGGPGSTRSCTRARRLAGRRLPHLPSKRLEHALQHDHVRDRARGRPRSSPLDLAAPEASADACLRVATLPAELPRRRLRRPRACGQTPHRVR